MDADTALIEASRRGDHAAFTQIVERYQHAVYAVSYASTRDRALADDVAQETFVAAWRCLGELRDSTRLPAWLCGIARNHARDALKRRARDRAREAADAPEQVDPSTPFDALSDAEAEHIIATALDAVPTVYREPLVLFYIQQRSVDDVARILGLNPRTTNKRISRGRQRLAARVGELVEGRLGLRGPKRNLAACVLVAIASFGSASHADASPIAAKGSIMPTLALATALVATVGGAGLLSASVATQPARPSQPAAASTSSKSPSTVMKPTKPPRLASENPIPDCATVARHLAQMTIANLPSARQLPAPKYEQFITLRSHDVSERCTNERWSDDRRVCAMSATDADDELACRTGTIGTDDELANLPPDLHCDAVAQHLADLATGPGGKFYIVAAKMAARGLAFDLQKTAVQVRDQARDQCDRIPWSASIRRCIAASKTHQDTGSCW